MPGFENLTPPLIAWIIAVIVLSGVVQGALGLGFPTLATPLIALVTDIRTAVIIVLLPCLGTIVAGLVRSGSLREALGAFWIMPLYMLLGAAIGTRLFIAYPQFPYALLLAVLIIIYLNLDRLGGTEWNFVRARQGAFGALFGIAAGLTEGTANVAAPALIVYFLALGMQPVMFVQALNMCFFAGKSTQFVTLAAAGGVTAIQWSMTLPLVVLATAGAIYGMRVRNRIDAATYRRWLRGALGAIAAILVAQYLYTS